MKKSVLALALAFGVTTAFAQDLTSKKGEPILPEAGDWGISVDATPFLNYAGNFFGKTSSNTAPTFNFLASNSIIVGKYFKDEKTAYRAGINIGFSTKSATNLVDQDNFTGTGVTPKVTDKTSVSNTGFGITAGIEKRKGKTRLQGYYGGEFGLYFGSTHQKNTYGNAFGGSGAVGTSTTPNSTTWATGSNTVSGSGATGSRTTDYKSGTSMQFGVRGFIGVEYFVLPKMSLGGEFGWGLGWSHQGAGQTITESLNTSGTGPITNTAKTGSSGSLAIGTDNNNSFFGPSGSLRMNFYF
ncbi:MAG: hypothetical protein ACXVPN_00020 [Bacteroidia bacterium]